MGRFTLLNLLAVMGIAGCAGVHVAPAQIGQTAGTIAGAAIAPGVGAPVGALVGALAGMLVQGKMDKAVEKKEREQLNQDLRATSQGTVQHTQSAQGNSLRVWVDETVENGRTVAGHFDVHYVP